MQVNNTGRTDVQALLAQMRDMRSAAQGQAIDVARQGVAPGSAVQDVARVQPGQGAERPSFTATLGNALAQVNETQLASGAAQEAFVRGERTDLVNVMVAVQKASVSFQAVTQVRNRLVEAYKDVMNMPI